MFAAHWREAVVLDDGGTLGSAVNQGVLQTLPSLGGTGVREWPSLGGTGVWEWGSPPREGSNSGTGRKKGEGALSFFLSGAARWASWWLGYGPRLRPAFG